MKTNKMEQIEAVFDDMTNTEISNLLYEYEKKHPDTPVLNYAYSYYIREAIREELETTIKFEKENNPDSELVKRYNEATPRYINCWIADTADALEDNYSETLVMYLNLVAYMSCL